MEMERSRSARSIDMSSSSSMGEIEEEPGEQLEKVYLAVKKDLKEGKSNLMWLLRNTDRRKKIIVVTHVHTPAQMIPMMGGKFHASKVKEQVVNEYRQHERAKMHKSLDDYMSLCSEMKVRAEKLVIEADDVAKALVELVALHGIAKLVMGAAADKHFSKKMKAPKSMTADAVKQQAVPSCRIWFVCRGTLIYTREISQETSQGICQPASRQSIPLSQSEQLHSRSISSSRAESLTSNDNSVHDLSMHRSRTVNSDFYQGGSRDPLSDSSPVRTSVPQSRSSTGLYSTIDQWYETSSIHSPEGSIYSASDELLNDSRSVSMFKYEGSEEGSVMLPSVQESDEGSQLPSRRDEIENGLDDEVYDRLRDAHMEAENAKHEAYKESLRRQKAERDAIEAIRRAKTSENLHAKEVNLRKDMEESLAKEKLGVEMLMVERDNIFEQLKMANKQRLELELHIAGANSRAKDLEEQLLAVRDLLNKLQLEHHELLLQRDAVLEEVEELRQNEKLASTSNTFATNFSEFSYSEIEIATCLFSNSLKIGEGGYGSVYRGFLRNTTVAIKVLNPQSTQGQSEFYQEVKVLSMVRHPNLVTLVGVCSESRAIIYEFLPNGSLEDRLGCKNNTPPLTWQVRTRIAAEICSCLIFLHSNKPHPIVHGDLKPENILLDANLVSKLSDFGVCRFLELYLDTTVCHLTLPKGTFAYMDPEYLATGELTPRSDVYSFGIIILQLLTGKPAFGIVKEVREALDKESFDGMIDPTAGDWPFVQARQLAHLGLRCCEISRKNRPDLVGEVWRTLESMLKTTSLSMSFSFDSAMDDNLHVPNYFICPIFQEIMRDPHTAADGFTYEAEALKGWIESGHKTSPMTNLPLPTSELIPNRALKSAIQEWMQQNQQV